MPQMYKVAKYKTKIIYEDDWTLVKLFNTYVVAFNDEWVVLNTGGWKTQTTKNRMNQTSNQFKLHYHVYQKKGEWYVVQFKQNPLPFAFKETWFSGQELYMRR